VGFEVEGLGFEDIYYKGIGFTAYGFCELKSPRFKRA
jgi:hypothetical protein